MRLYNACGGRTTTLCEAAIALRTTSPGQEETRIVSPGRRVPTQPRAKERR